MKTYRKFALALTFAVLLPSHAFAERLHLEALGVGTPLATVAPPPDWALAKQDGNVRAYTGWFNYQAALVLIETDPTSGQILRFSMSIPGAGLLATQAYSDVQELWLPTHKVEPWKQVTSVACEVGTKTVQGTTLTLGQLYTVTLNPDGQGVKGLTLSTRDKPSIPPGIADFLGKLDDGLFAGADPAWNGAYSRQRAAAVDADNTRVECAPSKIFSGVTAFVLGDKVDKQKDFEYVDGEWQYNAPFERYELSMQDAQVDVDELGRLNGMTFHRQAVSLSDFRTMVDNARADMGAPTSMRQVSDQATDHTTYVWKTAAGTVTLQHNTLALDAGVGLFTLSYKLRAD